MIFVHQKLEVNILILGEFVDMPFQENFKDIIRCIYKYCYFRP